MGVDLRVPNTYTKKIFESFYFVTVEYFWAEGIPVCNCVREETIFENTSFN